MILGEYEQTAVYKRYNVVGNGSDSVLETSGATFDAKIRVTQCWLNVGYTSYVYWTGT